MSARERLLCDRCQGSGEEYEYYERCHDCGGTGLSPALRELADCLVGAANTLTSFATWHAGREHDDTSARAWSNGADLLALHTLLTGGTDAQ